MANATYDALWQQAIAELDEQLNVEGSADQDPAEIEAENEVRNCATINIILQR